MVAEYKELKQGAKKEEVLIVKEAAAVHFEMTVAGPGWNLWRWLVWQGTEGFGACNGCSVGLEKEHEKKAEEERGK